MFTFLVIATIFVIGTLAYRNYQRTGEAIDRRKSLAWGWALAGAIIGSFFGVAGFGGAIIGTVPGAIVGWLIASTWAKKEYENASFAQDSRAQTTRRAAPQPRPDAASRTPVAPMLWPPVNSQMLAALGIDPVGLITELGIDTRAEGMWLTSPTLEEAARLNDEALRASDNADPHASSTAYNLIQKPASMGFPHAQVTLGWNLLNGIYGAPRDPEKAFMWNLKGATQGHPEGANNVGFQLEEGIGTLKNSHLAGLWYAFAASRGCQEASARFNRLMAKNTL